MIKSQQCMQYVVAPNWQYICVLFIDIPSHEDAILPSITSSGASELNQQY